MANIKKNFNFRNGVQVDDDNLLVTATGLVGIGTTVPTEALDVRGNVKIIGDATITNATVGVLTITNVVPTQVIGAGVSIKSGIITAQGSGIVTFYGDGINLLNLPTSQWEDTNAGFGVSSIYNTGGTVGIATTNPKSTIQIGDNPDIVGGRGVGISSVGDINASGIISATTFSGAFNGNLTGVAASTTQLQTARTIGGVSFDGTSNINLPGVNIAGNQDTSGSAASLSGTPNLSIGIINASGISTFSNNVAFYPPIGGQVDFFGGATDGLQRMRWRNNGSNSMLHFSDNVHAVFGSDQRTQFDPHGSGSAGHFRIEQYMDNGNNPFFIHSDFTNIVGSPTGGHEGRKIADFQYSDGTKLYHFGVQKLQTSGIGVTIYNQLDTTNIVASGVITATTELNSPLIGVGTDAPANPIQVRSAGNTEIQVTSDTGIAGLTVGREPSTGNTNNAEFRYGGGSGFNYSSSQSLDIINYGTGNFNYHLSAANAGNVDGDFHWHKGVNNARLMTLTGIGGSLGIGITTPTTPLHVLGAATISGNVVLGGDLDVTGNAALNVVGRVTGDLIGNVFANSGVSTFKRLDLDTSSYYEFGELSASSVGIGTTMGSFKFVVNADADKKFSITDSGNVGIKTDNLNGNSLFVNGALVALDPIGIGTNVPRSAVDFADAGQATTGLAANRMFMVPPKVTNAQRGSLAGLVSGAMIYNTNLNKLQVYNGSAWETITSS